MTLSAIALYVGALFGLIVLAEMFFGKRWEPHGKHCLVTGGSSGLGLALAVALAKAGAHVSIIARDTGRLKSAHEELEKARQSPQQVLKAYSFAVESERGSIAAVNAVSEPFQGRCPDAFFLCAGASTPGFFIDQSEASIRAGIDNTFYAQAFTALAALKAMIRDGVKGKIVFCASILAYFSLIGYSSYSPGKFALRGLADTLQSECLLYDIDIHIALPGTMYTKGLDEENKTKPKITLKIEETDGGCTPEFVAHKVLSGVRKGKFNITVDFIGRMFRASTAGASPRNSYALDWIHGLIGYVGLPVWRYTVDTTVKGHRSEHQQYLRERGFLGFGESLDA